MTIKDVEAIVRGGNNRVETLDLKKAYDRLNRSLLIEDLKKTLD